MSSNLAVPKTKKIILREREGGSELILTLLEGGDLSNFSFGEAHFRTPPS